MRDVGGMSKNISVIEAGGSRIYTVDEVSAMLSVPRPTLYRYLKEYSVPYLRRSGRILIPKDSLERIRKVRELHDEGLGTEAVRRRLGGETTDLEARLDRISERLEELRGSGNGHSSDGLASTSGDMRTLLARQTLLLSTVFDMSEMLEELLASTGRPRRTTLGSVRRSLARDADEGSGFEPVVSTLPRRVVEAAPPGRRGNFGVLARRRRRMVVALTVLAVLVVLAVSVGSYLLLGRP